MSRNKKVLVISPDVFGDNMAGPGIRYFNIAKHLSKDFAVSVLVPNGSKLTDYPFQVNLLNGSTLMEHLQWCDVVMVQGLTMSQYPVLTRVQKPIIVDLYDPFIVENLELRKDNRLVWPLFEYDRRIILQQLKTGDHFVCSSERQKDFWIGALLAAGRINPDTYRESPTLDELISLLPFGLPNEEPTHTRPVMRNVHPKLTDDSFILLWGGGIWDWLDPLTPIQAVRRAVELEPNIALYFMGIQSPSSPTMTERAKQAISLARQLGLYGESVFFNEWVPYRDRANYLLEADMGISFHLAHLETRYAFRTRMLDCIWSQTPIIAADGDAFSDLIRTEDLGIVIPPGDVASLAESMVNLARSPGLLSRYKENLRRVRTSMTWDVQLRSLVEFCKNPSIRPDRTNRRWTQRVEGKILYHLASHPQARHVLKRVKSLFQ